jgi:hypothetical protein
MSAFLLQLRLAPRACGDPIAVIQMLVKFSYFRLLSSYHIVFALHIRHGRHQLERQLEGLPARKVTCGHPRAMVSADGDFGFSGPPVCSAANSVPLPRTDEPGHPRRPMPLGAAPRASHRAARRDPSPCPPRTSAVKWSGGPARPRSNPTSQTRAVRSDTPVMPTAIPRTAPSIPVAPAT